MKLKLFAIFFCLSLASAAMAKDHPLPDSCGDDKTKFEVTEQKSTTALPAPDAGKALIVFLQPNPGHFAQRFAMDGKWVGATEPETYFTLQVEPGQHHFCSTSFYQSGLFRINVAIRSFEVKAGLIYFLQGRQIYDSFISQEELDSDVRYKRGTLHYGLSLLDEEKGRYQIKSYKLAVFKEK